MVFQTRESIACFPYRTQAPSPEAHPELFLPVGDPEGNLSPPTRHPKTIGSWPPLTPKPLGQPGYPSPEGGPTRSRSQAPSPPNVTATGRTFGATARQSRHKPSAHRRRPRGRSCACGQWRGPLGALGPLGPGIRLAAHIGTARGPVDPSGRAGFRPASRQPAVSPIRPRRRGPGRIGAGSRIGCTGTRPFCCRPRW